MSRKALGRGLKALIPETKPSEGDAVVELDIEQIRPSRVQPRQDFDIESIRELAASIRTIGIIQPVIVQHTGGNNFELIAGERRWRAAGDAGLRKVPAIVRRADDPEALEMALIENIQREDLNPIEAARGFRQLIDKFGHTQEEVAAKVGKDRTSIANHIRLLKLPAEIQEGLTRGRLTMGHARAILSLSTKEKQLLAWRKIVSRGLSVRETEVMVRKIASSSAKTAARKAIKDKYINALEDSIRGALATKVTIRPSGKGGTIQIRYFSTAELERLTQQLAGKGR